MVTSSETVIRLLLAIRVIITRKGLPLLAKVHLNGCSGRRPRDEGRGGWRVHWTWKMDNWEMGRVTEIGGIFGREEGRSGKGVEQTGET